MNEDEENREAERRMNRLLEAANEKIWLIRNDDGPVLLEDEDGRRAIPLWPDEVSAAAMLRGNWGSFKTEAIEHRHLVGWLENLSDEGVDIAAYPDRDLNGYILSAAELREILSGEPLDA